MSDKSIQELVEEISALNNERDLLDAARTYIAALGFLGLVVGAMPAGSEPAHLYLAAVPEQWPDFPAEWSRAFDGPCVRAAMHGFSPFRSSELSPPPEAMRRALAKPSGPPREALIVPIHRPGWGVGSVSFIGDRVALSREELTSLHLFSLYALDRAVALAGAQAAADERGLIAELTAREQQCLELVAGGLSDAQIAKELEISWSTAHYHVEHARRKLGARNRAHAVALAMRGRLV